MTKPWRLADSGGPAIDPYFDYVTMLLHGDGTNGAQNNTFLDSSTNSYTITRLGNSTQGSSSPYGANWSNYFDGNGDYLLTPTSQTALNFNGVDYTVEAWVYISSPYTSFDSGGRAIASDFLNNSNARWLFAVNSSGYLEFSEQNASGASTVNVVDAALFPLNQWVHVAATKSGTTLRLFKNGVQVGTATSANRALTGSIQIARLTQDANYLGYFLGYISNLRLVKGTALYTSNFTPPTQPLTAISGTGLLTCQSNCFRDASSNNFAISVFGNSSVQRFSPFAPSDAYSTSVIGGSGYFDGSGDYLRAVSSAVVNFGTGDFTVEMWVYCASPNGSVIFDGRSAAGQNAITLAINANNTITFFNANGTARITASGFVPSAWNHIAVTRSGTSTRLFCNGVQIGSTYTDSSSYVSGTNRPTIWGAGYAEGAASTSGYLSDVRVVKGTALYTSSYTPPTAPLTAVSGTSLLLGLTNAGIFDNAMMNDLQTVGNAQISTSVKKFGTGSLAFDGNGDYLTAVDTPQFEFGSGDFTVEAWIYINALSGVTQWICGQTNSTFTAAGTSFGFAVDTNNKLSGIVGTGSTFVIPRSTASITTGSWIHCAFVRDGSTLRLFINGTADGTASISTTAINNVTSTFAVGRAGDYVGEYLNGYIDDLRITKGVARYTANFTPPAAPFPNQ